jgi:hypothetical protein
MRIVRNDNKAGKQEFDSSSALRHFCRIPPGTVQRRHLIAEQELCGEVSVVTGDQNPAAGAVTKPFISGIASFSWLTIIKQFFTMLNNII